eukprot:CAMPEP_0206016790 /NCGR_PEP_ID=MMETSP1464-20131121/23562_1 /ASSEMBLY_ACC=CAM_ASM_001124 /TAXON_ID=119497 /ORGANISM="Exanthemachrysis gayraliae, Strain RCC1523" /LENGTH=212 /DNA_ID=CAMNT_0053390615 /DNA_START=55 /DNA_END=691 /DNA_ORIENTATION=-
MVYLSGILGRLTGWRRCVAADLFAASGVAACRAQLRGPPDAAIIRAGEGQELANDGIRENAVVINLCMADPHNVQRLVGFHAVLSEATAVQEQRASVCQGDVGRVQPELGACRELARSGGVRVTSVYIRTAPRPAIFHAEEESGGLARREDLDPIQGSQVKAARGKGGGAVRDELSLENDPITIRGESAQEVRQSPRGRGLELPSTNGFADA